MIDKSDLTDRQKQYIRFHKDLIDAENWDTFFLSCPPQQATKFLEVYQFLMFEAKVDLLHKMSYIPDSAFSCCEYDLGDLVIPSNIKEIGEKIFLWSDTITSIDLSKTKITELPRSCFNQCDNLKKVVLPPSVKTIDDYVFYTCNNLCSINLEGVEYIDESAFEKCGELKEIRLDSILDIDRRAFRQCSLTKITLPKNKPSLKNMFEEDFPNATIIEV